MTLDNRNLNDIKNKMSFIRFIIIGLIVVSCNQQNNRKIAYRVTEKNIIPEGITYSSTTNSFYVSSIHKTKIVKIDAKTGEFKDFIPSGLIDLRFLGMITDETHNLLWACGNIAKNGQRTSKVVKFNLTSGELIKSYSYIDSSAMTYNDIVLDDVGNVVKLVNHQGLDEFPKWSPDGSRIVFRSANQIHIMNADGTNNRTVTNLQGFSVPYDWK